MSSNIVRIHYSPQKWKEARNSPIRRLNGGLELKTLDDSALRETNLSPAKIVRLQYTNRNSDSTDGLDSSAVLSPFRLFYTRPSRTPTPPTLVGSQEVATIDTKSQISNESVYDERRSYYKDRMDQRASMAGFMSGGDISAPNTTLESASPSSQPQGFSKAGREHSHGSPGAINHLSEPSTPKVRGDHTQALQSMGNYQHTYRYTGISQPELEHEWHMDLTTVAHRLHFLKESYKAIQILKKIKVQGKPITTSTMKLDSSTVGTPLSLDDEQSLSGQSQPPILQKGAENDDESESNSNTDSPKSFQARLAEKRLSSVLS